MSAAGSHARKRGQARVHVVQPPSRPWMQLSRPELLLEVERDVLAFLVLVADHVVRARHDAPGAPRAQPGRDDLGVQLLPLRRPATGLCGRHGRGVRSVIVISSTVGATERLRCDPRTGHESGVGSVRTRTSGAGLGSGGRPSMNRRRRGKRQRRAGVGPTSRSPSPTCGEARQRETRTVPEPTPLRTQREARGPTGGTQRCAPIRRVEGVRTRSRPRPSSPVRMRTSRSTSVTQILPSPILPVAAAPTMASTTVSTTSSRR